MRFPTFPEDQRRFVTQFFSSFLFSSLASFLGHRRCAVEEGRGKRKERVEERTKDVVERERERVAEEVEFSIFWIFFSLPQSILESYSPSGFSKALRSLPFSLHASERALSLSPRTHRERLALPPEERENETERRRKERPRSSSFRLVAPPLSLHSSSSALLLPFSSHFVPFDLDDNMDQASLLLNKQLKGEDKAKTRESKNRRFFERVFFFAPLFFFLFFHPSLSLSLSFTLPAAALFWPHFLASTRV